MRTWRGCILICTLLVDLLCGLQFGARDLQPAFQQFEGLPDAPPVFSPRVRHFRRPAKNPLRAAAFDLPPASSRFLRLPLAQEVDEVDEQCTTFPNRTIFEPHFFGCETSDRPPIFVVHDLALTNRTGDYVYPLDLSKQLRVFLDLTSYANRRYDNMRAEVELYRRKSGWLGCGWLRLPTFALLDNFDVCAENNLSCPVYPGRQVFEIVLNPSILFTGLVQMIHSDRVPYQLVLRLLNNRGSDQELACVIVQTRIQF